MKRLIALGKAEVNIKAEIGSNTLSVSVYTPVNGHVEPLMAATTAKSIIVHGAIRTRFNLFLGGLSLSEANKPEELLVGSIIIKGNTLVYENQAIQINTLTAIWIDDLTVNVKNPFPRWIKSVATLAGLVVLLGLLGQEPILMAIGIVLASISIARYTKYVPNTKKPRFALGIEKASGECIIFPSTNKDAVDKAANALFDAISNKENLFETFIFNISKKVAVKKSVGSKIFHKKKPPAGPKLHAKKPTEKLVENIETLKPKPPQPATPEANTPATAPATEAPTNETPATQAPPAEKPAEKVPEGAGA